ncbi:hypothetical protein LOK49_LG14G01388 [Camellia lanceoleosa]|uniref:Uncharacterized protein n=1 Tax=Camellia lanceoleosa TaxID=1840588 RepID=A0ACC0FBN4_9ERIC|nr:hypothetical protein LOK49_LG14G01388 [Camellia lanceoleosa]
MLLNFILYGGGRKGSEDHWAKCEVPSEKLGSSGQRNATRCGLWWVEMLKTRDQFKEAATVYFRISGEVTAQDKAQKYK